MKVILYRFLLIFLILIPTISCRKEKESSKIVIENFVASDFTFGENNEIILVGVNPAKNMYVVLLKTDKTSTESIDFDKTLDLPLRIYPFEHDPNSFYVICGLNILRQINLKDTSSHIAYLHYGKDEYLSSLVQDDGSIYSFYNFYDSVIKDTPYAQIVRVLSDDSSGFVSLLQKLYDVHPVSIIEQFDNPILLLQLKDMGEYLMYYAISWLHSEKLTALTTQFYYKENEDKIPVKLLKISNSRLAIVENYSSKLTQNHDVYIHIFEGDKEKKTFSLSGKEDELATDAIISDNFFYITGYINKPNSETDYFVCKISLDGKIIWQKTFEGLYFESANKIFDPDDGFLYISGETKTKWHESPGKWLTRIDKNGQTDWTIRLSAKIFSVSDLKAQKNQIKLLTIEKNEESFRPDLVLYTISNKGKIIDQKNLLKQLDYKNIYPCFARFTTSSRTPSICIGGFYEKNNQNLFHLLMLSENDFSQIYFYHYLSKYPLSFYPFWAEPIDNTIYVAGRINHENTGAILPFILSINLKNGSWYDFAVPLPEQVPVFVGVYTIDQDTVVTLNKFKIRNRELYSSSKISLSAQKVIHNLFLALDTNFVPQSIIYADQQYIIAGYVKDLKNLFLVSISPEGEIIEKEITQQTMLEIFEPVLLTDGEYIYVGINSPPDDEISFYHPALLKFSFKLREKDRFTPGSQEHELLTAMKLSKSGEIIFTTTTVDEYYTRYLTAPYKIWQAIDSKRMIDGSNLKTFVYRINSSTFDINL